MCDILWPQPLLGKYWKTLNVKEALWRPQAHQTLNITLYKIIDLGPGILGSWDLRQKSYAGRKGKERLPSSCSIYLFCPTIGIPKESRGADGGAAADNGGAADGGGANSGGAANIGETAYGRGAANGGGAADGGAAADGGEAAYGGAAADGVRNRR